MDIGADGLKTGFTEESGYAIVGSASTRRTARVRGHERHGQRARARRGSAQAARLGHEGIRQEAELFAEGEVVGEAQVYGGEKGGVALKAKGPVDDPGADHQPRQDDRADRL